MRLLKNDSLAKVSAEIYSIFHLEMSNQFIVERVLQIEFYRSKIHIFKNERQLTNFLVFIMININSLSVLKSAIQHNRKLTLNLINKDISNFVQNDFHSVPHFKVICTTGMYVWMDVWMYECMYVCIPPK